MVTEATEDNGPQPLRPLNKLSTVHSPWRT